MSPKDPHLLTEDERLAEIALLLALGFLRLRKNSLDSIAASMPVCEPNT